MITMKATAHDSVFAGAPTKREGKWLEAGFDVECDTSAGEKYIAGTSGNQPSISQCKLSCEVAVQCQSITFGEFWCSHFSTPCTNRKQTSEEAVSMRFSTPGWFLVCGVTINVPCMELQSYFWTLIRVVLFKRYIPTQSGVNYKREWSMSS